MNYEYFPKLLRAALNNDRKNVEAIALMIGRKLKKEDPEISAEIMKILSCTNAGADVLRSIDMSPVPVDRETRSQLVKLEEPLKMETPILKESVMNELSQFLQAFAEWLHNFLHYKSPLDTTQKVVYHVNTTLEVVLCPIF